MNINVATFFFYFSPRTKQCVHNNNDYNSNNCSSCSCIRMEIVHRHYHEWLIYNHAWDPISGSALVGEPTLNPKGRGHCQKAGFTASTAYHLKMYHCAGSAHHRRLLEKKLMWFTNTLSQCVVNPTGAQRGRERFSRQRDKQVDSWGWITEFPLRSHTLQFNFWIPKCRCYLVETRFQASDIKWFCAVCVYED